MTLADTAYVLEVAVRLVFTAGTGAAGTARRHPLPLLIAVFTAAVAAWRLGYLRRDRWREGMRRLGEQVRPWLDAFIEEIESNSRARRALKVVEPYGLPTVEELAARTLARRRPGLAVRSVRR